MRSDRVFIVAHSDATTFVRIWFRNASTPPLAITPNYMLHVPWESMQAAADVNAGDVLWAVPRATTRERRHSLSFEYQDGIVRCMADEAGPSLP